jgi:hypothetical protein
MHAGGWYEGALIDCIGNCCCGASLVPICSLLSISVAIVMHQCLCPDLSHVVIKADDYNNWHGGCAIAWLNSITMWPNGICLYTSILEWMIIAYLVSPTRLYCPFAIIQKCDLSGPGHSVLSHCGCNL